MLRLACGLDALLGGSYSTAMMDENDNRVSLVTGATGLLGSHIVEQLCLRGRKVRAVVRPNSDTGWLRTQPVEVVTGDVTDYESIKAACKGVDTVYHSAAFVGDWGPWEDFVRVTIGGTDNVIRAVAANDVRRLLHISSISVYGYVDGEGLVFDETAALGYRLHKWSYYSRTKVAAEEAVWKAHREKKIQATIVRPSWLYGPRDRTTIGRVVANLQKGKVKLIGDGKNRLNVVHAGNVAECSILAADSERAIGEAYNCSNDGVLTQQDYFNMVAAAAGAKLVTRSVPYRVAHTAAFIMECFGHAVGKKTPPLVTRYAVWLMGRRCFFETKKAKEQLGWQSTVSYEKGIPMTVQWYLGDKQEAAVGGSSVQLSHS